MFIISGTCLHYQISLAFEDQWTLIGSRCYWFSDDNEDASTAITICPQMNSSLTSLNDQTEFDLFQGYLDVVGHNDYVILSLAQTSNNGT